ncbi:flavin reductase family protein [Kibdelosporangium aridum]|uniref:NADH-FMN oxidoreductase RutF, flavin reductase (DIM6/NTAB) family n=1 Tax=Kibdelosporangium aridum TaxID=2030 RepID=A0A1W2FM79_KIBAR|nr:flavin reductase family protein [Kibdelosporangium aridum]SMD22983.1 NADH-FMN oxidoreductase RutF, flavin reductase (DIM6/NTAB) family [Kibdelosporangium aridum]
MPERTAFRQAMSRLAKSVTVVTAPGPFGCTTTGVLSLSVSPPAMLVSLRNNSSTLNGSIRGGSFAVNVLSTGQDELIQQFATGDPATRFAGVPYSLHAGVPLLTDVAAIVVCSVRQTVVLWDHTLLIGTARDVRIGGKPPLLLLDGHTTTTRQRKTA